MHVKIFDLEDEEDLEKEINNFLDNCSASAYVFGHLQSLDDNPHVEQIKPPII